MIVLKSLKSGFHHLRQPGTRLYVLLPLLINVLIFSSLMNFGANTLSHWLENILHTVPSWLNWLAWLIWALFWLSNLLAMAYTFVFVSNLIAAPFNALLAERIQQQLGQTVPITRWRDLPTIAIRALKRQLHIVLYALPRLFGCLILFIIPVLQLIAPLVWFLWSAWAVTLQYTDYAADNNQQSFKTLRKKLGARRFSSTFFGGTILMLTAVPILNIFMMPLAVSAATCFWFNLESGK